MGRKTAPPDPSVSVRVLAEEALLQRTNRWHALQSPWVLPKDPLSTTVRLFRGYQQVFFDHLLPHWRRAGRLYLQSITWDWVDGKAQATKVPEGSVSGYPVGRHLAECILATEWGFHGPVNYRYLLLPFNSSDKSSWVRLQLLTSDLHSRAGREGKVTGVLVLQLVAHPIGEGYQWAGVVLVGDEKQQEQLRQVWLMTFGQGVRTTPPDLGPQWD
jgi:hypothetical protein